MPQNHQSIENFIELRSHYQSLNEESERSSSYVIEQLNHINALLVDQLVENQQFVESLLQLREHYKSYILNINKKPFVPGSRSLM